MANWLQKYIKFEYARTKTHGCELGIQKFKILIKIGYYMKNKKYIIYEGKIEKEQQRLIILIKNHDTKSNNLNVINRIYEKHNLWKKNKKGIHKDLLFYLKCITINP